MPPAASAAVAIRNSRSARARARAPSLVSSTAGAASKVTMLTRRVRSRSSWRATTRPGDAVSARNMARPYSVTAGTTMRLAVCAATTYQRRPDSRQPPVP